MTSSLVVSTAPVDLQLCVIAKEPIAGQVKTRLSPAVSHADAAAIARAALLDTLATVAATPAVRRTLILHGRPGPWLPGGLTVIPQRGDGLGARLDAAFADCFAGCRSPAVLVGMDTPQLHCRDLLRAATALHAGADAVIGAADDGGYWLIGFHGYVPGAFEGVPMSEPSTGAVQRARLAELGLRVAEVGRLRDVDRVDDALAVAGAVPGSRFARAVAAAVRTTGPTRRDDAARQPRIVGANRPSA